jgi:hypothetical protein
MAGLANLIDFNVSIHAQAAAVIEDPMRGIYVSAALASLTPTFGTCVTGIVAQLTSLDLVIVVAFHATAHRRLQ